MAAIMLPFFVHYHGLSSLRRFAAATAAQVVADFPPAANAALEKQAHSTHKKNSSHFSFPPLNLKTATPPP
jgi:hypothetical protein